MTKTQTLWAIGDELEALKALMDECNPELEPDINATLDAWFRELAANESTKLDCYAGLRRQLECEESALTAEAEQFAAKAKARRNEIRRIDLRVLEYIQRSGRTKVTTASGRVFAIQGNGGLKPLMAVMPDGSPPRPLSEVVDKLDATTAPPECTKLVIDAGRVRKFIEDGGKVPFAFMNERGFHLRLR